MDVAALDILTRLSVLLLVGLLLAALAKRMRISNVLLLLLAGLAIGRLTPWFTFNHVFLIVLATITLAIVVFEGTSRLSLRELDRFSIPALRLTAWHIILTTLFIAITSYYFVFSTLPQGVLWAVILAVGLAGTDPSSVLLIVQEKSTHLTQLLTLEAVANTPVILLIPFMILDSMNDVFTPLQLLEIVQQIIVGVGAGVLLGLIIFKSLRKYYSTSISNVAVIAAALLSFILAETLDGSGVLAVATLGIMFGNFTIKNKEELQEFSFAFSSILEVLIFLMIGLMVGADVPLTVTAFWQAGIIFGASILARLFATIFTFYKEYGWKDITFVTLSMPKGIAVAVLIFTFALLEIPETLLSMLFIITAYSIIASTLASYWYKTFNHDTKPVTRHKHRTRSR